MHGPGYKKWKKRYVGTVETNLAKLTLVGCFA
jgi:hypothetical protein